MKKENKKLRQLNCRAEIKATGKDEGIVEAYVSVFNNVDAYGDVIEQGAFAKSLKKKLPKGVWMHNWDEPIAKTLEAREDPHGLYIKGQLILEVEKAREAYALMKNGVIDEFSIGFYINDQEYDEVNNVRRIKEITLIEWSPVLAGANPDTELISVKAAEAPVEGGKPADEQEANPPAESAGEAGETDEGDESGEDDEDIDVEDITDDNENITVDKSAEVKIGKVLSEKNRALVSEAIDSLGNLQTAIKNTIKPLQELLDASNSDDGVKVGVDAQRKILRIRSACKQIDRAGEFILRLTKS